MPRASNEDAVDPGATLCFRLPVKVWKLLKTTGKTTAATSNLKATSVKKSPNPIGRTSNLRSWIKLNKFRRGRFESGLWQDYHLQDGFCLLLRSWPDYNWVARLRQGEEINCEGVTSQNNCGCQEHLGVTGVLGRRGRVGKGQFTKTKLWLERASETA